MVIISILVVVVSQVNSDENNSMALCQSSSNHTVKINSTNVKRYNIWNFSLGVKWFNYIINTTVFIAGCFGNFLVIYVLGIRKGKVIMFISFLSNIHITALTLAMFILLKMHFINNVCFNCIISGNICSTEC